MWLTLIWIHFAFRFITRPVSGSTISLRKLRATSSSPGKVLRAAQCPS